MNARLKPQLQLRALRVKDFPRVLEIERAGYPYPWTEGIFQDCLRAGYHVSVLTDQNGTIHGYYVIAVAVGEAHLLNLCVAPDCQREGHGQYLLDALCAQARDAGADTLFLEVRPSNLAARHLYERANFEQIGRRRGYYPAAEGREDALVLAKRL